HLDATARGVDLETHGQARPESTEHVLDRTGRRVLHIKTRRLAHIPAMVPTVDLALHPPGPAHAALPAVIARLLFGPGGLGLRTLTLAHKVLVMRVGRSPT